MQWLEKELQIALPTLQNHHHGNAADALVRYLFLTAQHRSKRSQNFIDLRENKEL